jgi:hypothetical protein
MLDMMIINWFYSAITKKMTIVDSLYIDILKCKVSLVVCL